MISTQTLSGRRVVAAECALVALATFRATPGELPALRKTPDPSGGYVAHPSLLRHADEHTVVGLAAVLGAIHDAGLDFASFGEWAVLAAPRYLGRAAFERAFPTFQQDGAWGVSPHLIPAHSLHSPSGTISQALKAHGPNLGVGGTPGGEREALLFASTLLLSGAIPGAWVVLTGRDLERDGTTGPAGDYEALALALTLDSPGFEGPRLRISPDEVQAIGPVDSTKRDLNRWLTPGLVRVDEARASGAIPRPHVRPTRGDLA